MPGYDLWKCDEPVDERELEAERARCADEDRLPKYKLAVWYEDFMGYSWASFSVHYPGDRGWITLNEASVVGHDLPGALRCMRAARRLFS